jgi:hypothetical protein
MEVPAGMSWRIARVRRIHRLNALAPACAIAAFIAVALLQGWGGPAVDRAEADRRVSVVGSRVASIPYRLGDWVGRDIELPAAALEILHSSAAVSRNYSNLLTGEQARLAIVFCGDVRDMLGHHPPSCYPSSGWTAGRAAGDPPGAGSLRLKLHGREVVANVFRFSKPDPAGGERQITIVGFFALPGVGMTPDPAVVRSRSTRRAVSSRGAGQVQVLFDGFPAFEKAGTIASDLLQSIPESTFEMLIGDRADETAQGTGNVSPSADATDRGSDRAETEGTARMADGEAGGEP